MDKAHGVVCLVTDSGMGDLCASDTLIADATYYACADGFYQMLVIHGKVCYIVI